MTFELDETEEVTEPEFDRLLTEIKFITILRFKFTPEELKILGGLLTGIDPDLYADLMRSVEF